MTASATPAPTFACRLGRHRRNPLVRWNEGYYFTRCRRCGVDLVRTVDGPWRAPKGFRVIWSSERPETVPAVAIRPDRPADHFVADAEPIPSAQPTSYVPDFMDDAQTDTSWRRHAPGLVSANAEGAEERRDAALSHSRSDFSLLIPALRRGPSERVAGGRNRPPAAAFVVAALVLIVLSITALALTSGRGGATAQAPDRTMFVTDRMTSCRAMPERDAAHVRYLVRGDAVRFLRRQADWAIISYGGELCWLPLSLLSVEAVT